MPDNTVDALRSKTEEADLNSFLKPAMGGYTKKSVLDYLAYLKQQQQDKKTAEAEALARLQREKEQLQQENKSLEAELKEAVERIAKNEEALDACRSELGTLRGEAEKSAKNAADYGSQLETVSAKNEELTLALAEMSGERNRQPAVLPADAVMPTQKDDEEADAQMQTLLETAESMQEELSARTELLGQQVYMLNELIRGQLKNSRGVVDKLRFELQDQKDQTVLLESERDALTARISEVTEQNLHYNKENTRLKAENVLLQRRLEMR